VLEVPPPPLEPPPPVVLVVVAGAVPPELELGVLVAPEELLAPDDALVPELELLGLELPELDGVLVVVLAVVVLVVPVVWVLVVFGATLADAAPGTVSGGASTVSAVTVPPPPPQPASASAPAPAATRARSRRAVGPLGMTISQESSGAMRRPQYGQSLRSLGASWSHQLQKRRFSTAQGSSDTVGASGSSWATTSSSSPVSRSR
jgi:hypothetical protein